MDSLDDDTKKVKFEHNLILIDVDSIIPNRYNPREEKAFKNLDDITKSIEEMGGILVPILAYEKSRGKYVILDGERRWRASKILAKKDEKYRYIPANIINEPLDRDENFLIMFNVHMERTPWSTGATARAIGELKKINPHLSDKELAKKLHVKPNRVTDSLLFLMAPKDLQEKVLKGEGDIEEYHVIYLIKHLKSIQKIFPELVNDNNFNDIFYKIINKVEIGVITNYREFSTFGSMLRVCSNYDEEDLFKKQFNKIIEEKFYTPKESIKYVNKYIENKYAVKNKTIEDNLSESCDTLIYRIKDLNKRYDKELKLPLATINKLENVLKMISDTLKEYRV